MCTFVLVHRLLADAPLIALANRDEFLHRPAAPPALRAGPPRLLCGLDEKEGGTWFGINAHGLIVGLTNLTLRPPDPLRPSRGLLCLDLLRLESVDQVRRVASALAPDSYNPFNVVAADSSNAIRVRYDHAPTLEQLDPGVHVTTNWPPDSEGDAKRRMIEARVTAAVQSSHDANQLVESLDGIARTHDGGGNPLQSICCHVPGYGTRSSTIVALGADRAWARFLHSEGAPCEAVREDSSTQLFELWSA
ncbi:MAG: NRDE family protein [Polyangiaceae bacterium]|jgi:uncharacterized protein with NRDE domain|nr:NRDE family protein [Polyangiaceae bacterium]